MTDTLMELAKLIGALSVIGAGFAAVSRWRPVRWLLRRILSEPLGSWFREHVAEAVEATPTAHLVDYHLGPNSGTTPLHQRIQTCEEHAKVCPCAAKGTP